MDEWKLGVVESKFADIIWANEPLHSRELVQLCQQALNRKKPTTYTVLRKLCERIKNKLSRNFFRMILDKRHLSAIK